MDNITPHNKYDKKEKECFRDTLLEVAANANLTKAAALAENIYQRMKEYMLEVAQKGELFYVFDYKRFSELYQTKPYLDELIKKITELAKADKLEFKYTELERDNYCYTIGIKGKYA